MEHMNEPQPVSQKTLKIAQRFADESRRAAAMGTDHLSPPKDRRATDMNDYKAACEEMLQGPPLLSEDDLKRGVDYIMQDSKLKIHFPEGFKCFPAVIPFNNFGNALTPEELQRGAYVHMFLMDPQGKTVNGFSSEDSYVGDFLPADIQNIAFTIGKYEHDPAFDVTEADRKKLAEQYTAAFRKLQKLMGNA